MNGFLERLKSRLIARYRGSSLERFLDWWLGELAGLTPGWVQARLSWQPEALVVVVGDDEWLLLRRGGERPAEIDRFRPASEEADLTRERLPRLMAGFESDRPRTILRLPRRQVLTKRLKLPAAAEENLRQVLSYEMDRQTPFRADRVYFDFRIDGRDPRTREITLDLVVVPREVLDRAADEAESRGLVLDRADAPAGGDDPGRTIGVNLLPPDRRHSRRNTKARLNAALGAAAVVLLGLVMWQSLAIKQERIETLEQRVAGAREEAMAVAELRAELEDAVRSANFLVRKKEEKPVLINVLREVTELLPDDTWLTRFQLNGDEIQLYGESSSASRLIGILDESPILTSSNFISPVTTNTSTGDERFNLEASVLAPEARKDEQTGEAGSGPAAASR